ncbi:hypothetical protein C1J03_05275 [Sulfitobacter sp. SK012]|uniref:porin family protein n=1 Tax=Sulfitobacter sp. SK012 TaxID=1389005 RepID=UPI000E0B6CD4|nr:porin family protein [Sulfitobacter sp. SK012]AXI45499.1 hypothetical protein C1J03_05275 [Sulfitobacter sp. SK012]
MKFTLAPFAIAATCCLGVSAQAQEWKYATTVYLFTAETETSIGDRSATLSFSDALKNLDMAFMASFGGNNGQWGFLVDYMLTDIGFENSTPGPAFSGLEASVKTQILTGYLSYRLYDTGTIQTDLLAGARWFDTDTTLTFLPGAGAGTTVNDSDNWTDPVIGVRTRFDLNADWSGTVMADYGGSSDRETWQLLLTADYAFNEKWVGRLGYRHIDISNDEGPNNYAFTQSGPVFGITYNF